MTWKPTPEQLRIARKIIHTFCLDCGDPLVNPTHGTLRCPNCVKALKHRYNKAYNQNRTHEDKAKSLRRRQINF